MHEPEHDQKYFAMLNNAVALTDTQFEGGNNSDALAYYQYLLSLEIPECPLSFNLSENQSAAIRKGIADLIQINHLIEKFKSLDFSSLDDVIGTIEKDSEVSRGCYLPSGWFGKPGHFAGLKLRRLDDQGHYAFSVINHGGGMEYHHEVSKPGSKDWRIYQSDEYEVDLHSNEGRELLQKLIELQFPPPPNLDPDERVNGYGAADLYGLLKLYGKEIPLTDKLSEKAVTPQRSGTCTVTNVHAIGRDILIDNDADLKTRKRYHFVLKLRSIIAGFNAYLNGKYDHNVMEWALREFSVRLNKEYRNILTDEEVIYCGKLQSKIKEKLDQDKQERVQKKCAPASWPDPEGVSPAYSQNLIGPSKTESTPTLKSTRIKHEIILMTDKGKPNLENRNNGIYLYRDDMPEKIYALVIHDKKHHEVLNLTDLDNHKEFIKTLTWFSEPSTDYSIHLLEEKLPKDLEKYKNSFIFLKNRMRFFYIHPDGEFDYVGLDNNEELGKKFENEKIETIHFSSKQLDEYIISIGKQNPTKKTSVIITNEKLTNLIASNCQYNPDLVIISPENIVNLLDFEPSNIRWQPPFPYKIYQLLNQLPHCSGHAKDEFWDKVPKKDIKSIIESLFNIAKELNSKKEHYSSIDRERALAMSLMIYDIAAQLAPRYSSENYAGFKLDEIYALGLDDIYSEQSFYSDPIAYHTVKRIAQNFAERSQGKQRVLTNAVNYDNNQYDNTVHYVINVLLNHFQRQALMKEFKLKKCSDLELFDKLMENLDKQSVKDILDPTVVYLIGLSATAHAQGQYTQAYKKENGSEMRIFAKTQFFHEVERQSELSATYTDVNKHLPKITPVHQSNHLQDFSENTIYHPRDDLTALQNRYNNQWGPERSAHWERTPLYPYQLYLSGSLTPESALWKPDAKQQIIFEELNEKFRHIECSPNLQVVRVLAWMTSNPDKLIYKEVRARIYELLFQYGKLDSALTNQLEPTLANMADCFSAVMKYCKDELVYDADLLFWLGNLAYDLRYHAEVAAKIYSLPIEKFVLPNFQELLLDAIRGTSNTDVRSKLASQVVRDFHNRSPLSLDDCCLLLTCRMVANLGDSGGICDDAWNSIQPELLRMLKKEKNQLAEKLNQLLPYYIKSTNTKAWSLVGSELIAGDSHYFIDLIAGALKKQDMGAQKERTEKTISDNKELFAKLHLMQNDITLFYSPDSSNLHLRSSDDRWDFSYYGTSGDTGWKFVINSTSQKLNIESQQAKFKYLELSNRSRISPKGNNPFESDQYFMNAYQYWQSSDDENIFFIRQENSEYAYYYSKQTGVISQLVENKPGEWQRNGKILLNLVAPQTKFETQWAQRLQPLFGVANIRCTANLSNDLSTCRLERIEHLALDLNFTINDKQQLMCENEPGYYLVENQSLPELYGLPSVVILQNEKGHQKFIIPAFSLNKGEKNNAFNQEDMINYGKLCHESCRYFEYTFNRHHELEGKSVEANLYLAILYRSLGDFKRAMQCLECCKTHHNITAATVAIAMQVLERKIKSPLGAAFDLKLECYLREHQQKWSDDKQKNAEPVKFPDDWQKWLIKTQMPLYKNTFSSYKTGVAIQPNYCRLTNDELIVLGSAPINPNPESVALAFKMISPEERLAKASHLPASIFDGKWDDRAKYISNIFDMHFKYYKPIKSSTWRFYDKVAQWGPACSFMMHFFNELFADAISCDSNRINALYKKLYALLLNDADPIPELYDLIALLAFSSKYPAYFKNFNIPSDNMELIKKVGSIFVEHKDNHLDETCYLLEYKNTSHQIKYQQSLPSDFVMTPVKFAISAITHEKECKHPIAEITHCHFSKIEVAVAKGDFALDSSGLENASALEKNLCDRFKKGHQENQKKTKSVYTPAVDSTLDKLIKDLTKLKKEDLDRLKILNCNLIKFANKTPLDQLSGNAQAQAYNLLLSRASEQHHVIAIKDLFAAFLQQDPTLLTAQNPFLTQEDIEILFAVLADYALLHSRVDQIDDIFKEIIGDNTVFDDFEPYQLQLLASTLDKPRCYIINDYPEFLVYEYATKRILRDDQAKTLMKIIALLESDSTHPDEMHHALLQFAAGGGKTSVLIPILAHRFARKGFLPVIFNTHELYETGLADIPQNLRASLEQNMEVIERELEHTWTVDELKKLLKDLERWRSERKCLLMKPVTWHSINIAKKLAYFKGDQELANAAEAVLDFFKTKTIKLEDESHIISDPLQQCIKTYGPPLKVPDEELDLILRFYDYLMGNKKNAGEIPALAGIKSKQKSSITADDLTKLQKKIANVIADEDIFDHIPRIDLITYLLQPDKKRPEWLWELYRNDKKTAELIVLARAFIKSHLPHILTLQDQKDYGVSIHDGDLTVAPKHEGKDVTSHFGDHTLVSALTIQMYQQRGLSPTQVEQLLEEINNDHKRERAWNHNLSMPTEAELWLMQFNKIGYSFKSYRDLTPEMKTKLSRDSKFYTHPIVVKKYLTPFVLPQIKVPVQRQTSTAAELQAGFDRSLLLSATPGLREIYAAFLKSECCFLEEAFEAQVLDTLTQDKNSQHCELKETQTPSDFFAQLSPELLASMTTLIDRGALLTDFQAKDIIMSYLGLDEKRVKATTAAFFSKKQTHLRSTSKDIKEIDITGTGLVEALKKQDIKPEQFLLFLFLDLSKTTGIDIKRPFKDHAGLTVGKHQTVTETIQAAMRERQLLEEDAQTITWIMFQALYHEINPKMTKETFNARDVFYWMIRNEAKQLTTKLINRAYQGIDQAIHALAWQAWRENPQSFPQDYQDQLKQEQSISPWDIYEVESIEDNAEKVLSDYRDQLLAKFGFKINDPRIPKETLACLKIYIDDAAALIDKLQTPPKAQLDNKVQQETKAESLQKEEREQQQQMKKNIDTATDFEYAVEHIEQDNLDNIFKSNIQPLMLPGCEKIKQPNLLFCQEHFAVTQKINQESQEKFDQLKPIDMVLVKINPDKTLEYVACTAAEANYYSVLMNNHLLTDKDPLYAIITPAGKILSTSNNTSIFQCKPIIQNTGCQKILAYVNFLNGEIHNPIILSQLIQDFGWTEEQYNALAKSVTSILVSCRSAELLDNFALKKLCGWSKKSSQDVDTDTIVAHYLESKIAEISPIDQVGTLHPVAILEKDPGESRVSPPRLECALEGYVLGRSPSPVEKISGYYSRITSDFPQNLAQIKAY